MTNFQRPFLNDAILGDFPEQGEKELIININSETKKEYLKDNKDLTVNNQQEEIDIKCTCGHCILTVSKFDSLGLYSFSAVSSFWARVKKAWKLLTKGEKFLLEDLVISDEDIKKIANFVYKNSTSKISNTGYKGITYREDTGKFQAQVICYNKSKYTNNKWEQKTVYAEHFEKLEDAVAAREQFILKML